MPFLAPAPSSRASRLAAAAARWDAVLAARPDLAPAVELQQRLIGLVVDLAETVERGRLPRLSLPPRYLAAKLARGVPALAGEPVPLPVAALEPTLLRLCEALAGGGAGEAADHVRSAIAERRMDPGALLVASLSRDQKTIRAGAAQRGLVPDLVWLVAELTVSPFVHALQHALFTPAADPALAAALAAWNRGYCPACGSWAALAEVVGGCRILRCSLCALAWELPATACVYCREQGQAFTAAVPGGERTGRRIDLCGACHGYLKTVEVPELSPFPLLAIADLETVELDLTAMERGYVRPPLKEFARPAR